MGSLEYRFSLDKWLVDNGYTVLKSDKNSTPGNIKPKRSLISKIKSQLPNRAINYYLRFKNKNPNINHRGFDQIILESPNSNIDWKRTKAFAITGNSIFINDNRFRDSVIKDNDSYFKLREEIISKLNKLSLPDGRFPFPDIQMKEGQEINGIDGPDIILNHNFVACRRPTYSMEDGNKSENYFKEVEEADDGSHRREGILIISNSEPIQSDKIIGHDEFFGLVLNLFGLELPDNLYSNLKSFEKLNIASHSSRGN
jgi:predicted AlkP superfamily phosphohydrolase/phosphomutase